MNASSMFEDETGQNFSSLGAALTTAEVVSDPSQLAKQDQDQKDKQGLAFPVTCMPPLFAL
jgi:hypothetical protein